MKRLIIVDDKPENRYMLESLLKGDQFEVDSTKNGVEALALARKSPPDLIISDILMPVMDGFTLCKEWRKDETLKQIPFIFYTAAYTDPKDIKFAYNLGADRYLLKPLEPAHFLTVISEVLNEYKRGLPKSKTNLRHSENEILRQYNSALIRRLEDKLHKVEVKDRKLNKYAMDLENIIHKLEKSEENLRLSNDFLDNMFNNANAPVIVWNAMFIIIRFNRAFEHLTGYNAGEVVGQKLSMLFPEINKKESLSRIKHKLNGEQHESFEIPILTKNGEIRTLLLSTATFFNSEGKAVNSTVAQGQDITARKQAEELLKASEAKLKVLNATKDKLFSIIGHDLKSPLNGILGISNVIRDEAERILPSTIIEYADLIGKSANQVFRLLDNLLNWARVQQGELSYHPTSFPLKFVADEEIELMGDYAKHKRITISDNIPDELIVTADNDMLKVVVRNLLSNAIKFTPMNGKIEFDAVVRDGEVEISVKDNGKGISKDNLGKLFKIDTNFTTPGTAGESGTGLGLILTREFAEKHSGNIWAESEVGEGSIFHFTIPQDVEQNVNLRA